MRLDVYHVLWQKLPERQPPGVASPSTRRRVDSWARQARSASNRAERLIGRYDLASRKLPGLLNGGTRDDGGSISCAARRISEAAPKIIDRPVVLAEDASYRAHAFPPKD